MSPPSIEIWGDIEKTNETREPNGNNKEKTIVINLQIIPGQVNEDLALLC